MLDAYKQKEAEIINAEYDEFKASWLSIDEWWNKKAQRLYAIEQKKKKTIVTTPVETKVDKLSCLHFSWKSYINDDIEDEYGQEHYKRERELID